MTSFNISLNYFLVDFPVSLFGLENNTTGILLGILFLFIVYTLIKANSRSIKVVHSHWHQMFETRSFTPEEFYDSLKKEIYKKGIEKISLSKVSHSEGGFVMSANRIYLRVRFREYMMDICAAPFAKEAFFVSWWLGDAGLSLRDFLISIPFIGWIFSRREKTFYEHDTEIMFKETVARCVKDTIEQLVETKGQRLVDLVNWKGMDLQFKSR